MSSARVQLRYRPGADVLSGRIDLGDLDVVGDGATVDESPDADTRVSWSAAHNVRGEVAHYVSSFQLVHAAARLREGDLPLPVGLNATISSLIATALQSIEGVDNPISRVRAQAEANTEIALDELRRTERPQRPPGDVPDRRRAARVSASLSQLADTVQHRTQVGDELEALNTDRFSRLLRELSSTIEHGNGHTAPGTSAATRAAARAGVPFSDDELQLLQQALDELDKPQSWQHASRSLDQLVVSLTHHGRR